MNPIERPKGTGTTAIGKRKKATADKNGPVPKKTKFFDQSSFSQGLMIATWFTNWPKASI